MFFLSTILSGLCLGNSLEVSPGVAAAVNKYGRRAFLQNNVLIAASALGGLVSLPSIAQASDDGKSNEELMDVYFGCGCFWHAQHEFVEAERRILGRSDMELSARAGYAGGKAGASDGKVCYHNALQTSDYGKLGHAEVVRVSIPPSQFDAFALEYVKLFNKDGYRADQWGDAGPEYRNLVGILGGVSSPYARQLVQVSQANGNKLDFAKGRGDDPDARSLCFIMDSNAYPFFVAEQYHQFHDGFNWGEDYPNAYNGLASKLAKAGTLGDSQCPNGSLGLGVLGL